jgi:pyruvate formate lyase activating enzyme
MTLSGGEPLAHASFSGELLRLAREAGISTAVETSGFAPRESLDKIIPYTDIFLYDFKESDEQRHIAYTGVSSVPILSNLRYLSSLGKRIVLRCPIIPGYNDRPEHFRAIGTLAQELDSIERVDVEPYHPLGISKCESIGRSPTVTIATLPSAESISEWIAEVKKHTTKQVLKS